RSKSCSDATRGIGAGSSFPEERMDPIRRERGPSRFLFRETLREERLRASFREKGIRPFLRGRNVTALICGSVAYDNIMVFEDSFKNHILPDKIHILNVSFLVPRLRREFGGCAANIAYNLKLLGEDPLPMATVGQDFDPYRAWLDHNGIRQDHIMVLDGVLTAQAFITTDLDDNQITAFHPGAMNFSERNDVRSANGVKIGMVSPDGRAGMIQHAAQFAEAGIPFVFDPGQGLPMFQGEDLRTFIEQATWVTVNDYEWQLMKERTGWDVADVTARTEA